MLRPLKPILLVGVKEPEGSDDYTEVTLDEEQSTLEPLDTFLMGDEVNNTILERENDEFIKSSVDNLVPIPRESELTLDREHIDTLSTRDREVDFNPSRDIEELERLLADDPVPAPRVFDAPLGNSDSISRSYDVTFSNPLLDFNDDYTLCYDNPLFDEEFEDISSLDPPESTLVINESSLLVTPLPDPKQICLREMERFDPIFSLTQSGGTTRMMETPSFGFHHMASSRPAAYSPKKVMYCYYHHHLTSGKHNATTVDINVIALLRQTIGSSLGKKLEQQDLSLIGETQFVVEVGKHVDFVVDDEVLHMLVSMVEKNELFDELMIAVMDTE
ncbi:hypothetical protein Tco_0891475 [Tanacetum coccineum]|uniref:Uncharacterized protein n=1 Tax=Tanacetum coccineum TaxID=301880 RepID=A0ABQ5C697_9ASTR